MRNTDATGAITSVPRPDIPRAPFSEACSLAIAGVDLRAPIRAGDTLLQAGLRAGIKIPHLCMVGDCGSCRCRLVKGEVKLKTDISHHIDAESLQQGHVLACQCEALSDVELAVPGLTPTADNRKLVHTRARITSVKALNHDIRHLVLALDQPMSYEPGQYAQLTVPGEAALAHEARCYSFCSAPVGASQSEVQFHVRRVPGGAFTEWLFSGDRTGQELQLSGPLGDFRVHDASRPMVCIAGGSGLAPIKAMLEDLRKGRTAPDVTLFFAARTQKDLYCLAEIALLQRQWPGPGQLLFMPILSMEPADSGWSGLTGYCDEHLAAFCNPESSSFYLCGPPAMIDAITRFLETRVERHHIHFDRFLDRSTLVSQQPLAV